MTAPLLRKSKSKLIKCKVKESNLFYNYTIITTIKTNFYNLAIPGVRGVAPTPLHYIKSYYSSSVSAGVTIFFAVKYTTPFTTALSSEPSFTAFVT